MYSKNLIIAIVRAIVMALIAMLLCSACAVSLPWSHEPIGEEVNLGFVVRNNLLFLTSAKVDGTPGRFLFAASDARTALDPRFAGTLPQSLASSAATTGFRVLQLNQREALRFTPVLLDLHSVADGIIGADVWGNRAVSIDYTSGLITYQKEGIHPGLMTIYRFAAEPRVSIIVNGSPVDAIVDTSSPDTLTLPRHGVAAARTHARVQLAGSDLGDLDIRLADVAAPRIGNRILSKFLVTIDYGKREVGLWRDPRTQ
jgi:hypothetical protein